MTLDSPSAQTQRCMSDIPQAAEADPHYPMPVPNLGFPQFSEGLTITPVAHVRNLSYLTPLYSLLTYYSVTKCDQGYNSIFLESLSPWAEHYPVGGQNSEATPPARLLDTPLPSPHMRSKFTPLGEQASKGASCLFSLPLFQQGPNKALPERKKKKKRHCLFLISAASALVLTIKVS